MGYCTSLSCILSWPCLLTYAPKNLYFYKHRQHSGHLFLLCLSPGASVALSSSVKENESEASTQTDKFSTFHITHFTTKEESHTNCISFHSNNITISDQYISWWHKKSVHTLLKHVKIIWWMRFPTCISSVLDSVPTASYALINTNLNFMIELHTLILVNLS